MKFYKDKNTDIIDFWKKIYFNKLTAIHSDTIVRFVKNGKYHNAKNAAFIKPDGCKQFCLNGKLYGDENDFAEKSWRKFVKMQVFL